MISSLLDEEESFVIGLVEGAIIFDEDPMPDSDRLYTELIAVMREKNLASIVFERGLKAQELSELIDILTGPPIIEQDLRKTLDMKGITHIQVKAATEEEGNYLEVYNGALEAVINAMDEVRLGKIPSSGPVNKVTDDLTESVLEDRDAMIGLAMIKNYDNYLFNHSVNVAILSVSLAGAIGLSRDQVHNIGVGAILHDIGKTGVAEQIIRKPGGLSSEEWQKIREHPQIGADIIKRMDGMDEVVSNIVYEHHIKYDETGYPEEHGELNPLSQIVTICDAYDALTTLRVYQKPHNPSEALKIMTNFSGKNFHPDYLKTFTEMIGIYPVGTLVRLSTNEIGIVTKVSAEMPSKPVLKIIFNADGSKQDPPILRDLAMDAEGDRQIIATVEPASLGIELGEFFKHEAASEDN
ncbi:MAG: HD-GYP domain-containing protein [Thermodesulfobacteriota bacterium]